MPKLDVIEVVKDIIIKESGIDINLATRKREIVETRSLFFHVVRHLAPLQSYESIGRSVNRNHATVLFAVNQYETYAKFNKELDKLRAIILKRFRLEHAIYHIHSIDDEIRGLEERLTELKEFRALLSE